MDRPGFDVPTPCSSLFCFLNPSCIDSCIERKQSIDSLGFVSSSFSEKCLLNKGSS